MSKQQRPLAPGKDPGGSDRPAPLAGEPLDGRHYLDVVEEQQYAGKPFVKKEQDSALGNKGESPAQPKNDH